MPCKDSDISLNINCSDDQQWIVLSLKLYLTAHQFLTNFTHLLKLRLTECNANFKVLAPSGALNVTTAALMSITQTEYSKRQLERPGLFYDMFSSSECQTSIMPGDIKFKVSNVLRTLQGTFDTENLSHRIQNTLILLAEIPSHMPSRKLQVLSLFLEELSNSFDPTEQSLRRPLYATQTKLVLNFVITFIRNWGEVKSEMCPCIKSCRFCQSVINDDIREWGTLCCKDAKDFYEVWQEWVARQSDIADIQENVKDVVTICASPDHWDDTVGSPSSSCCNFLEQGTNLPDVSVCARYRKKRSISADFADAICDVEKKSQDRMEKAVGTREFVAIKSPGRRKAREVEESSNEIELVKEDLVVLGARKDVPAKVNEFDRIEDENLMDRQDGAPAFRPTNKDQAKVSLYRPLYRSQAQPDIALGLTEMWQQKATDEKDPIADEIVPKEETPDNDVPKTKIVKSPKALLYRPERITVEETKESLRKPYRDSKAVKINGESNSEIGKIAEIEGNIKTDMHRQQIMNKDISVPTIKKEVIPTTNLLTSRSDQSPIRNQQQRDARIMKKSEISQSKRTVITETKTSPRKTAGEKTTPRDSQRSKVGETIQKEGKHDEISRRERTLQRKDHESMERRKKVDISKATSIGEGKRKREDIAAGEGIKGIPLESKEGKADSKVKEDAVKKSEYSYGRGADKSRDTDDEEKLTRRQVGKKARADIAVAAGEEMDDLSKSKEAPGERRKKADAADSERRGALYRPDEEGKVAGADGTWKGRSNPVKQGVDELDLMNGQKLGGENLGAMEDKLGLTADSRKKKEEGSTIKKESRHFDTSRMTSDDYGKINGTRNHKRKPPLSKLEEAEIGPANPIEYQLSNEHFVRLGWTVLPVTKSMRKIVQYQARPAKPHLDWFKKRNMDGTVYYGDGFSPFVQFHPDESAEVFYPNGRLAIKVHRPEDRNYDMYTVFTPGGKDSLGIGRQSQIIAVFDSKGNGVLFDEDGGIRLSYNQIGGMCIDNPSGDPYAWLWSRERKQPVTRTTCDERSIAHLEKYLPTAAVEAIGKSGGSRRTPSSAASRNKEKKAAEQKPVVEEQEDEATSGSDFQEDSEKSVSHIKMVCMKLNEYLSLRIVDRKNITLNFSSGCKSIKIHLGTILNLKKVVNTYTVDSNEKYSIQENKYQNALISPVDSTSSLCEFSREMRKVKEYAEERNKYMLKYKPFAEKLKGKSVCKSC